MNRTLPYNAGRLVASQGRILVFAGDQATHDIPLTQIRGATVIEAQFVPTSAAWLGVCTCAASSVGVAHSHKIPGRPRGIAN